MKKVLGIMLGLITVLFSACALVPQEGDEEDDDSASAAEGSWADGLTLEQVIKTMPISVEVDNDQETVVEDNGVATAKLALDNADEEAIPVKVEWTLPVSLFGCKTESCTIPSLWKIYEQSDDETWELKDVEVTQLLFFYGPDTVTYQVDIDTYFRTGQYVKYFKVEMQDLNDPAKYHANIVTFLVCPGDQNIRVTLLEASADADSRLFVEFTPVGTRRQMFDYVHIPEGVFENTDTIAEIFSRNLKELALPVETDLPEVLGSDITMPKNSPIKFTIRTDFSDPAWGFEDDIVVHQSNSSFCKVEKIDDAVVNDDTIQARFKFAFEDLPLSKKAIEANGLFDYNDLVLIVDVMKLQH